MKYFIQIDTVNGNLYKTAVSDFTDAELEESIQSYRTALARADNLTISNGSNSFIIRCKHIIAVLHVRVQQL